MYIYKGSLSKLADRNPVWPKAHFSLTTAWGIKEGDNLFPWLSLLPLILLYNSMSQVGKHQVPFKKIFVMTRLGLNRGLPVGVYIYIYIYMVYIYIYIERERVTLQFWIVYGCSTTHLVPVGPRGNRTMIKKKWQTENTICWFVWYESLFATTLSEW